MKVDMNYTINTLKKYLAIGSPGGYTKEIIDEVRRELEEMGVQTKTTNKGALIATIKGKNDKEHVALSAHVDTIGAMVKDILPDGMVKFHTISAATGGAVEGENCYIITRHGKKIRGTVMPMKASLHVFRDVRTTVTNDKNLFIRIDEKICTKEDVLKLGISVGDFIYLDTRTEITESGFVKSRYLDDKSLVATVFAAIKYIKENEITPCYTTHFYFTNYEEIGHGVGPIPERIKEFIGLDIGPVGGDHQSDEYSVSICAKDSISPYNFEFRNKLVDIAEEYDISYKVDVYNGYGSDATLIARQGTDVNFACFGPGVHGTHHYERTHVDAIENTIKLIIGYITHEV